MIQYQINTKPPLSIVFQVINKEQIRENVLNYSAQPLYSRLNKIAAQ